jgi:hypothetical protein
MQASAHRAKLAAVAGISRAEAMLPTADRQSRPWERYMIANTKAFELLSPGAVRDMLRSPGPCITITLPPYRPGEPGGSPAMLLKAYIQEAATELRASGYPKWAALTQPLQEFAEDPALSAGSHCGRAIFCSPSDFEQFYLTTNVAPSLCMGGSFSIRKFGAELARPQSFYVLSLSKTRVGLLRCTGLETEAANLPPGVPGTLAEALALEQPDHDLESRSAAGVSRGAMHMVRFGTGSEREHRKTHLADYYKIVDRGIQQALREPDAPLILAGVEEDTAIYRAVNTYDGLTNGSIAGSPDVPRDNGEILRKAYSILHRERIEQQHAVLLAAKEQSAPSRLSTSLDTILRSAFEGRVGQLYVNEDATRVEEFKCGTYRSWNKEDLLNLAAVQTIVHRGKFCELPAEMMQGEDVIGVMRF